MQSATYEKLYRIAEPQAGYFTTAQAGAAGVDRNRLSSYTAAGQLERVRPGIYRLASFPRVPHEDLFVAWLAAGPDSVISHDSALAIYELSDALPARIHVTVPRTASRRRPGYRLHTNRITPAEITYYGALRMTTVPRTIVDVALDGLSDEFVEQAACQAVQQGLTSVELLLAEADRRSRSLGQLLRQMLTRGGLL